MDDNLTLSKDQIEPQYLISTNKFLVLSLLTFGLYNIWWFYKVWRFLGRLESRDLAPAFRAIFALFFTISLFDRILHLAKTNGYEKSYSSAWLFVGYLFTSFLGWLPEPFYLVAHVRVLFVTSPFEAFNYAVRNVAPANAIAQENYNGKQIGLLVIGTLCWILVILGTYISITEDAINL